MKGKEGTRSTPQDLLSTMILKGIPTMGFNEDIQQIWEEHVHSQYLFRGMSAKDVADPLDPGHDPFEEIRPQLFLLLDLLQQLLNKGFQFQLREEHFGAVHWHELKNIVKWTRRDLEDSGIDFTSDCGAARDYSDCCQGSQLKQNFKCITEHLPEHRNDPVLSSLMSKEEWQLVSHVSNWVLLSSPEHRSVVIHVRRSCPILVSTDRFLPVGSLESFKNNAERTLADLGCQRTADSVLQLLPKKEDPFDFRLRVPLPLECIDKIESVTYLP